MGQGASGLLSQTCHRVLKKSECGDSVNKGGLGVSSRYRAFLRRFSPSLDFNEFSEKQSSKGGAFSPWGTYTRTDLKAKIQDEFASGDIGEDQCCPAWSLRAVRVSKTTPACLRGGGESGINQPGLCHGELHRPNIPDTQQRPEQLLAQSSQGWAGRITCIGRSAEAPGRRH